MGTTRSDNQAALRRLQKRIRDSAEDAVGAGLAVLEVGVRRRCPVGATREMLDSIHTDGPSSDSRGARGAVVVGARHAIAVEYGTSRTPAHPFVRPTREVDGPRAAAAARARLIRGKGQK